MTFVPQQRRPPPAVRTIDVWTPGDEIEMDALIAACALVAQADGWVTPDERQRMVERMRRLPAVAIFGTGTAAAARRAHAARTIAVQLAIVLNWVAHDILPVGVTMRSERLAAADVPPCRALCRKRWPDWHRRTKQTI